MLELTTKERIFSAILHIAESLGGEASIRYIREGERCEIFAEPQATREFMRDVMTALLPTARVQSGRIAFRLDTCEDHHIDQLECAALILTRSDEDLLFAKELKQAMQALYRKLGGYGEETNLSIDHEGFRVVLSAGSGQMLMLAHVLKGFVGAEHTEIIALRQGIESDTGIRNQVAVDLEYFASPERMVALHQLVGNYRSNASRVRDFKGAATAVMLSLLVLMDPFPPKMQSTEQAIFHLYDKSYLPVATTS
ncbi:MAG: hypothetical protein EB060_01155 [Proteobacteria bacterium]|nr:hypothetical protein [Pseudomonadota bacterium]